jgi:hypothetical protein
MAVTKPSLKVIPCQPPKVGDVTEDIPMDPTLEGVYTFDCVRLRDENPPTDLDPKRAR